MNTNTCKDKVNVLEHNVNEVFDDETADELAYDDDAANKILDYVYTITHGNSLFNTLYMDAAAKMLSIDPSIGISVLFSYDYFELFNNCIKLFIQTPELFNSKCNEYVKLYDFLK
jgi:hypothetical protein